MTAQNLAQRIGHRAVDPSTRDEARGYVAAISRGDVRTPGLSGPSLGRLRKRCDVNQADVAMRMSRHDRSGPLTAPELSAIESGALGCPRGFVRIYLAALAQACAVAEVLGDQAGDEHGEAAS